LLGSFFEEYRYEDFTYTQWALLIFSLIFFIPFSIILAVSYLLYKVGGFSEQYYKTDAGIKMVLESFFDDFLKLPIRY
jgi:hypothetical protein